MIATLYGALTGVAFGGFVVAGFGALTDRYARYPRPLLVVSLIAGLAAQGLLK